MLKLALGEAVYQIPISATKPLTGHTLAGAGGALELISCCLMMQNEFLHPTINFVDSDPSCDLDFIPNIGHPETVDTMMSLSFWIWRLQRSLYTPCIQRLESCGCRFNESILYSHLGHHDSVPYTRPFLFLVQTRNPALIGLSRRGVF